MVEVPCEPIGDWREGIPHTLVERQNAVIVCLNRTRFVRLCQYNNGILSFKKCITEFPSRQPPIGSHGTKKQSLKWRCVFIVYLGNLSYNVDGLVFIL